MPFTLSSPAFRNGEAIPERYTCDGADVSPPLEWSGAPDGTRSFVLILEDPDAPSGIFRHWAVYDIAAGRTLFPEAVGSGAKTEQLGHGINDFGDRHYRGPCPPKGYGAHRYYFRLAALDVEQFTLPEPPTVAAIWEAAQKHVLAEAEFMGTYTR